MIPLLLAFLLGQAPAAKPAKPAKPVPPPPPEPDGTIDGVKLPREWGEVPDTALLAAEMDWVAVNEAFVVGADAMGRVAELPRLWPPALLKARAAEFSLVASASAYLRLVQSLMPMPRRESPRLPSAA